MLKTLRAALAQTAGGGDTIDQILRAVRLHLGMDIAFASEFTSTHVVMRHVDAAAEDAPIRVGDAFLLEAGYCQRIVDGRLPQLIPDTALVPEAAALACTASLPVGAHLSVPIVLSDGRAIGTFCCFSFEKDPSLNERDVSMMRVFAQIVADQFERDREAQTIRDAKIARIRSAIDQWQFSIAYQPIYEFRKNRVVGLECLSRFLREPERTPDRWFADAAEVGLGAELELAAIRLALAGLASLPADVYLTVNVSPPTVLGDGFAAAFGRVPLDRVILEITEHTSIPDYPAIMEALQPLRSDGMRIAVDDAGAGYSSFRHVLDLHPDLIKLDMSLIRNIDRDPARRAFAVALCEFARTVGSEIIAEGIETEAELEIVKLLGVSKVQGYLIARPMPLDAAVAMLDDTARRAAALG